MTQPPKGGPAFANTPDVPARTQAPAAGGKPAGQPTGQPGANPTGPVTPISSATWSAPAEAPTNGAAPAGSGIPNGSGYAGPPPTNGKPAPVGVGAKQVPTNGTYAPRPPDGFGQPTISNGSAPNGGITRTAAPGALAALDAQAAAAAATTTVPPRPSMNPAAAGVRGSVPAGAPGTATAGRRPPRGPRRARLQLRHLNPWSVLKFSCVLSVFLFFMWMLTIAGLYEALNGAGIIGKINDTVTTINGSGSSAPVTVRRVLGGAVLIGVINMVMFIALSTVGSVIYNFISDLIGGVELTLSEGD
jgi:Transmembrane domain of unknown function (DUF3566)